LLNTEYAEKTTDDIEKILSGYWRDIFPKFFSVLPALPPAGFRFFGVIRGYIRAAFQIKTPPQETGAEKVLALFLGLFSPQPKERQKVEARTAMWNFGPTLKGAKPYTAASIHHPLIPVVLIIRFRIGGIHG
jgi:hypothetical protein